MTRKGWLVAALIAAAAAAGLALETREDLLPLPASLTPAAPAADARELVDRRHVPLNATYATEWNVHDVVALHEIPALLRDAFVVAEDKRFRAHRGPDWRARLAALALNVRHLDAIRGASTITEQAVRLLHPRPRTIWSRWLEGFEAARLERAFTKDEILEFYLNQVPYASRRRGVKQAAEMYFARDLATLSDREMLTLAVLVRSPSRLDLRKDAAASAAAVERLADAMLAAGALDADRHAAILAHGVELATPGLPVYAPHFVAFAADAARQRAPGARVVTTLDAALQANVQRLLDTRVAALADLGVEDGAVLVADNATGDVLAWAVAGGGDPDGPRTHIDAVTTPRQPGSALKPFLYALALDLGASVADVVVDAPLSEDVGDGLHRYRNYSDRYHGPVTLRDALGNSLNIPALKTLHRVGVAAYLERLRALGFESLGDHPDVYGDGLALGNGAVTLHELVEAYLTLANRGRRRALNVLASGKRADPPPAAVFSAETASLIGDVLADADARSAEFGRDSVLSLPVQTAVKTGTSSDYRDAWAVGYDARFTVGVWIGNLDQTPTRGVTGAIGPALLLRGVFAMLNRDGETAPLYSSPRLTRRDVCVPAPAVPDGQCLERAEWFDPAHADAGATGAARAAGSIGLRQPTPDLELAVDPRLPAAAQAFEFRLDGVEPGDRVRWTVDGAVTYRPGAAYPWTLAPGAHSVAATVYRDGRVLADLAPVDFTVR